jgi:hypothetical protein
VSLFAADTGAQSIFEVFILCFAGWCVLASLERGNESNRYSRILARRNLLDKKTQKVGSFYSTGAAWRVVCPTLTFVTTHTETQHFEYQSIHACTFVFQSGLLPVAFQTKGTLGHSAHFHTCYLDKYARKLGSRQGVQIAQKSAVCFPPEILTVYTEQLRVQLVCDRRRHVHEFKLSAYCSYAVARHHCTRAQMGKERYPGLNAWQSFDISRPALDIWDDAKVELWC